MKGFGSFLVFRFPSSVQCRCFFFILCFFLLTHTVPPHWLPNPTALLLIYCCSHCCFSHIDILVSRPLLVHEAS